jgi:ABC-type cobalamin transport system permease subunit
MRQLRLHPMRPFNYNVYIMAIGFVSGIFIVLGGLIMVIPIVISIEYCLQLNRRRQQQATTNNNN